MWQHMHPPYRYGRLRSPTANLSGEVVDTICPRLKVCCIYVVDVPKVIYVSPRASPARTLSYIQLDDSRSRGGFSPAEKSPSGCSIHPREPLRCDSSTCPCAWPAILLACALRRNKPTRHTYCKHEKGSSVQVDQVRRSREPI